MGSLRSLNHSSGINTRPVYQMYEKPEKQIISLYWTVFDGRVIFSIHYTRSGRLQFGVFQITETLPRGANARLIPDYFALYQDPMSFDEAREILDKWYKLMRGGVDWQSVMKFPDLWKPRWEERSRPFLTTEQLKRISTGLSVSVNNQDFPVLNNGQP